MGQLILIKFLRLPVCLCVKKHALMKFCRYPLLSTAGADLLRNRTAITVTVTVLQSNRKCRCPPPSLHRHVRSLKAPARSIHRFVGGGHSQQTFRKPTNRSNRPFYVIIFSVFQEPSHPTPPGLIKLDERVFRSFVCTGHRGPEFLENWKMLQKYLQAHNQKFIKGFFQDL